ncbi:uncharacterized protein LOC126982419 [Eriocheir sinensis]|uniref:uncharacterized protein LOC126982419 n=1 Tax=Eriocheir sinensis TaxID=95602 RepID=UPI0021C7EB6D|nr:uncharacterized protein LOC126982419 [Eriocheir sinensis]
MKVWTQHILRYVCPAAAVYLVATQVCSSFLKPGESERQPMRGVTGPDTPSCRALFTVTDVARRQATNVSLFIHDLQGYSPPHKLNGDWRARAPPGPGPSSGTSAATAGVVRQLLLKRDSPSGASTADYSPLAALLPSVLARQAGGEGSAPTVTTAKTKTTTRIDAAGGLLPYVPCQIATYADPASATACFRERLRKDDSLWIFFMGDSKIRYLFYEFLARTDDELHYLVKLPVSLRLHRLNLFIVKTICIFLTQCSQNSSKPFSVVRRNLVVLNDDREASSVELPGLLVSFEFRTFENQAVADLRSSAEVQQLARWAAGLEAPPHLLVLGYSSWMLRRMTFAKGPLLHDALGYLTDMHKVGQRTRVVVTSQGRYKNHAAVGERAMRQAFLADPNFGWSEAAFLHYLRRHPQQPTQSSPPRASSARVMKERGSRHGAGTRDHLVPGPDDGGVWWWDTILPLSLAENSECEELFHSGLAHHSLYTSAFLRCYDDNHVGNVTLGDQVMMLLNLACNSVLGGREGLCCG